MRRHVCALVFGCSLGACTPGNTTPPREGLASATAATERDASVASPYLDPAAPLETVVVASCIDQTRPMPILGDAVALGPDAVLLMGDNVYANASTPRDLERAYADLAENPQYAALAQAAPILATWDDHDYGRNDVGAEYELKRESKAAMLDFFAEPPGSARRTREGIYDATIVGPPGQRVQIILLDTRWFRDPLKRGSPLPGQYVPHGQGDDATILGEAQWTWLETQLREPADLRLVVTSIQLLHTEHGFEGWGLFPAERQRLFEMIGRTKASGVVLLSGDRHRGELSCAAVPTVGYPLLELTASSINRPNNNLEDNRLRRPGTPLVGEAHFGSVQIDWETRVVTLALHTLGGEQPLRESVPLAGLQSGAGFEGIGDCEAD